MHLRHFKMSGKSSANNGLVRYDDDSELSFLNLSKRTSNIRKNLELFRGLNIIGPFPSQNAVAVEEYCPGQGQSKGHWRFRFALPLIVFPTFSDSLKVIRGIMVCSTVVSSESGK